MSRARTASGPPARERILQSARRLFYERGIRAVGVEAVVEDAGVTKMSLYRHFASKDGLVAACLGEREAAFWAWFDGKLAEHRGEPRAQLLALFRGLAKRTTAPGFRGCPMTNAAIEFPEPDHPGRKVAETHKRELWEWLRELAAGTGASDPEVLADGLLLLFEGAYTSSQTFGPGGPARSAGVVAERLLDSFG
jgi:AcrR family transcriptional regulator